MLKRLTNTWQTKLCILTSGLLLIATPLLVVAQDSEFQISYSDSYFGWQIDSFDSVIEVHEDASLTVTETIETQMNPTAFKHGIFRDIPIIYRDDFGNRVKVDLSVTSVLQNGLPVQYDVSRQIDEKRIKIGNPNAYVSGPVTYEIQYTVDRAMLYFDAYDEVYWNVTGTDWEVPIVNTTAVVVLPDGTEALQSDCYTGDYGSNAQDCGIASEENLVAFAADDFLTVAVGFPKGIVHQPTFLESATYFVQDNWVALIPLSIIFVLFLVWFRLGRDPRMGSVVAEFKPPEKISALKAGFLVSNTYTGQLNGAMIVQMAVQGYVTIKVEEGESKLLGLKTRKVYLIKEKDGDGLDKMHKKLFDAVFSGSEKKVSLSKIRSRVGRKQVIPKIIKMVKEEFKKDGIYSKNSFKLRTVMFVLVTAPLFWLAFFVGGFFGPFAGFMFFAAAIASSIFSFFMPKRTRKGTELARKVLGFKSFMHTAERYRSKWHEEQNMFTEFLPYAIAFNDVKKWANTFKDLEFNQPSWYVSNVAMLNAVDFGKSLNMSTMSLRGAMQYQSSPSSGSGGSSGGGFSGGGFGGGGGGSW